MGGSRCLLRLYQLLLRVFSLNGREGLRNACKAFHSIELLLAVKQHHPQPKLEHRASSCAFDIPLAVPDQRE